MFGFFTAAAAVIAVLVVYHHAVYPLFLALLARRRGPAEPSEMSAEIPRMTVIMPVRNEAALLGAKLKNLAALDYPREKLRIIAACDGPPGSSDAVIAENFARAHAAKGLNVDVMTFSRSRGKTAVLNDVLPMTHGAIAVLTDVSAMLAPDALSRAAKWFSDSAVGAVAAGYRPNAGAGAGLYWRYQRMIKRGEAALGAPVGASGALYFIRGRLFEPMPADTVNDDVMIPMTIAARGFRVVYDESIAAEEAETDTPAADFRRRRRIAAGNLQQAVRLAALLPRMRPGLAFAFVSGKGLRAVTPLLLAAFVVIAAGLGLVSGLWAGVSALTAALGLAALLRFRLPRMRLPKWADALCYAAAGYAAGFIGAAEYMLKRGHVRWSRAVPVTA
ncbi:MAG: glycosyltransferase family 2 protein [Rhodospirillales bacterium]